MKEETMNPLITNISIMMMKDKLFMRQSMENKKQDLPMNSYNNLLQIQSQSRKNRRVGNNIEDDEYISLVYSVAIEKLNQEKTDLKKLQVQEEGDSLKIAITTAQKVNYIYVALESNGKQANLNQNDNFGNSLQFQNPTLNYNLRTLLFRENKRDHSIKIQQDC
ncbi:unnamed protein product [Paramecium sonneborni]|uniref:Uncharacterized protein n=1 Tax=Paramecium sonneborni TaxID=65129 RepID=A0A8S1RLR8_9CILI|nr:unnamed protein product [Paramecium sonneborni]